MKLFEILNRLAWINLVYSFLLENTKQKQFFQLLTGLFLIVSFVLEVIGI